jgi:hypothetical protein
MNWSTDCRPQEELQLQLHVGAYPQPHQWNNLNSETRFTAWNIRPDKSNDMFVDLFSEVAVVSNWFYSRWSVSCCNVYTK